VCVYILYIIFVFSRRIFLLPAALENLHSLELRIKSSQW